MPDTRSLETQTKGFTAGRLEEPMFTRSKTESRTEWYVNQFKGSRRRFVFGDFYF